MAVRECEECGGQVSTKAAACPHCGYARKRWYSVFLSRWWVLPLVVVLCIYGVLRGADGYATGNVHIKSMEFGSYIPSFSLKNVVVENDNWFAVRDVEILCHHKDKHGRTISQNDVVTDWTIPAGEAVNFTKLGFGTDINIDLLEGKYDILPAWLSGGKSIVCEVSAVNIAALFD